MSLPNARHWNPEQYAEPARFISDPGLPVADPPVRGADGRILVQIRQATLDDAARISALIHALAGKYIAHEFSAEGARRLLDSLKESAIREYMLTDCLYHLAEEHGEMAGVVGVSENIHLYHLFVSEEHQGRGLARRLWDTARCASQRAGNPGVFTVNSSLHAAGMYEKFGFVRESGPVDHGGVVSIPMKLKLI